MTARTFSSIVVFSFFFSTCGTDGKAPQPLGGGASIDDLPAGSLPAEMHGEWTETRYWTEGRTDGPSFYNKASIEPNAISLTSGESSKDSGEWTISGRCGVAGDRRTKLGPFVVRMLVEQSSGEELHPAPSAVGEVVELKIHLIDDLLHVDYPGGSAKLSRPGRPQVATSPTGPAGPEFACASAADCLNSCNHGAVNKAWYAEQYPGGERCEDGCTSKGTEPAQCIDSLCVAFRLGRRSDDCTRRKAELIPGIGPAHSCATDDDCTSSCTYGAVNRNWYSYSVKSGSECKDGCASKGADAKCEEGRCVAYLRGERSDSCTGRNIHNPRP